MTLKAHALRSFLPHRLSAHPARRGDRPGPGLPQRHGRFRHRGHDRRQQARAAPNLVLLFYEGSQHPCRLGGRRAADDLHADRRRRGHCASSTFAAWEPSDDRLEAAAQSHRLDPRHADRGLPHLSVAADPDARPPVLQRPDRRHDLPDERHRRSIGTRSCGSATVMNDFKPPLVRSTAAGARLRRPPPSCCRPWRRRPCAGASAATAGSST